MNNKDTQNIDSLRQFFDANSLHYSEPETGIFDLAKPDNSILQVRYINSQDMKIGYLNRFGYDGVKQSYCYDISKSQEDKGTRVIWVRDFEYQDARKLNVLKSYILTACGKVETRIFARHCEIREVSNATLRPFLDNNCFHGYRSATLNLGLYTKRDVGNIKQGTLVMVWTLGHAWYGKNKYDLEIIRAATLLRTQVVGGASKLFDHIKTIDELQVGKRLIKWNSLVFYVDYCHNDGASLPKIGFRLLSYSKGGFMNLNVSTGIPFNRKPKEHGKIMQMMKDGLVVSTPLAGVKTFVFCKNGDYSKYGLIP